MSCNHGLARFKDDPELLEAALAWMRRRSGDASYMDWMRERKALAQRRYEAAQRGAKRRRERYRERYAADPEYREQKLADNVSYRKRAGVS